MIDARRRGRVQLSTLLLCITKRETGLLAPAGLEDRATQLVAAWAAQGKVRTPTSLTCGCTRACTLGSWRLMGRRRVHGRRR